MLGVRQGRAGQWGSGAGEKKAKLDSCEGAMPNTKNSLTLNDQVHRGQRSKEFFSAETVFFFFLSLPLNVAVREARKTGKVAFIKAILKNYIN